MRLRIARKICKYMGHGYPINNIGRLEEAVRVWHKAFKRFKHFKIDFKDFMPRKGFKCEYYINQLYKK